MDHPSSDCRSGEIKSIKMPSPGRPSHQLSNKEYQLLVFLMQSPNKVHARSDILHGVWGDDFFGDDNLLDVYIRYLRQKIEAPHLPKLIHTVRGVGFMVRQEG